MDSCSLFSCFPAELILTMRLGRGEEHSRGKCPPPDSDPFNAVEYGRIYANLSRNLSAEADCGFKFQKRGQLFIRSHNGNAFRRRDVRLQRRLKQARLTSGQVLLYVHSVHIKPAAGGSLRVSVAMV